MKLKTLTLGLLLTAAATTHAQTPEEFIIEMEPLQIANAPGVHSYSWAKSSDEKWVIIGGRIDGLHRRQPWASFWDQDNNHFVFVIDPVSEQVWSSPINVLPTSIYEQLKSTNQEFHQHDSTLYIVGGYGFSATANDHITYPNLTAVSIDELTSAVINGTDITPYFRQISDNHLKVTGGQIGYLDGTYYLVGGQLFDGAYNPMGPDHGPGFIQEYTNEIRTFEILDDGTNLSITNYVAQNDTVNLHRRDYNMAPQIFPGGTEGFTAFSGVFDYSDMPYLNTVDVMPSGYNVNNTFNQYLSQYHSAKLPIYDANAEAMHTMFFGGMSQFKLDNQNNLVEDVDVPFVKTISRVTRLSDGSMQEIDLGYIEMPTLVGSGAEFIPTGGYYLNNDILDINSIPQTKTLVGYIFGGIESSGENIFFINDGTQSSASNIVFKVYINKSIVSTEEITISGQNVFNCNIYPVPARNKITIEFYSPKGDNVAYKIIDSNGRIVKQDSLKPDYSGDQKFKISLSKISEGAYNIILSDGINEVVKPFVKQ